MLRLHSIWKIKGMKYSSNTAVQLCKCTGAKPVFVDVNEDDYQSM